MAYSLTFKDAIDHVRSWLGGDASDRSHLHIMQGILSAHRDLTSYRKWSYLTASDRITLDASYSTGTVSYVDSTRTVTLAGGTFPAWAASGDIIIGNVTSRVIQRVDSTTLLLDANVNPSADATAEEYTLVHTAYELPTDFVSIDDIQLETLGLSAAYVQPSEWLHLQRTTPTTGAPEHWTIMGHPRTTHRMALFVDPAPAEAATVDFIYGRRPRELTISGYETAHYTGKIARGSTPAFTGTSTDWDDGMVGAIIRVGSTTETPGPRVGPTPYWIESEIQAVDSTTSLDVVDWPSTDFTNRGYVISDPIDIDPIMTEAFLRCCEKCTGIHRRAGNMKELDALFRDALYRAEAGDSKVFGGRRSSYAGRRLSDFPMGDDVP